MSMFPEDHPIHQISNRMEQFAMFLTDVIYCFSGKAHRLSRDKIVEMIDHIVHDEHLFYMIYFMGAYNNVKKEKATEKSKQEIIEGMEQLMGWEKRSNRDKTTAMYEFNFEKAKQLYQKKDINPKKEFNALLKLYYKRRDKIKDFINSRSFYKEILDPIPHITLYVCVLLGVVADFFRETLKRYTWDQMENVMGDVFEILLEWISIVAGLTYYHLKYDLGTEEQVSDLLDTLKEFNAKREIQK